MPLNKPAFSNLTTRLNAIRSVDFAPTADERNSACLKPLERKGAAFLDAFTLGGTCNLRRGARASREGRTRAARREYAQGVAKFVAAVPLAPVGLVLAASRAIEQSIESRDLNALEKRSAAGLRENALAGRLRLVSHAVDALRLAPERYLEGAATVEDLREAADSVDNTLRDLEKSLATRGVLRLQTSPLIQTGMRDIREAQVQFRGFVGEYSAALQHWAAAEPTLVNAELLGAPQPPADSLGAYVSPPVDAVATQLDRTIMLQTQSGAETVGVLVNARGLAARCDYFRGLLEGPLAADDATPSLTVDRPIVARDAIVALLNDRAPAFEPDNFLEFYRLFDMWGCETMLELWRRNTAHCLRRIGLTAALDQAQSTPGSSLAQELLSRAWHLHMPVGVEDFARSCPPGDSLTQMRRARESIGMQDAWLHAERIGDGLKVDWRWRIFQPRDSSDLSSLVHGAHGLDFYFSLRKGSETELDTHHPELHLLNAPTTRVNITRLVPDVRCYRTLASLSGIQEGRIHGDVNGVAFDKSISLRRTLRDDGSLQPSALASIKLGALGGRGTIGGQQTPLFFGDNIALHLRATITGPFGAAAND